MTRIKKGRNILLNMFFFGIYNEIIKLIDEVIDMKKYNEHILKINELVKNLYLK